MKSVYGFGLILESFRSCSAATTLLYDDNSKIIVNYGSISFGNLKINYFIFFDLPNLLTFFLHNFFSRGKNFVEMKCKQVRYACALQICEIRTSLSYSNTKMLHSSIVSRFFQKWDFFIQKSPSLLRHQGTKSGDIFERCLNSDGEIKFSTAGFEPVTFAVVVVCM